LDAPANGQVQVVQDLGPGHFAYGARYCRLLAADPLRIALRPAETLCSSLSCMRRSIVVSCSLRFGQKSRISRDGQRRVNRFSEIEIRFSDQSRVLSALCDSNISFPEPLVPGASHNEVAAQLQAAKSRMMGVSRVAYGSTSTPLKSVVAPVMF
jgi:hypothetical protein